MDDLAERLQRALGSEFTLMGELARGGMGIVYRAREHALDRLVAIKVLLPDLEDTGKARERFARESRLLALVDHPNVVKVYRAAQANEPDPYFVMELIQGETLEAKLRGGPLDPVEVRRLGADILGGLGAIHAAGVIHRDLKPSNILLTPGRALIADFGIASRPAGSTESSTGEGSRGTPGYMAPEQWNGGTVGSRGDFYTVGAILFQCLTGRRWPTHLQRPRAEWRGIPWGLRRPLRRALRWNPEDRWPDAATFARSLAAPTVRSGPIVAGCALLGLAILLFRLFLPEPTRVADLVIEPMTGCAPAQADRPDLSRYVALHLEWFPEWQVALAKGGKVSAPYRLEGDFSCGPPARLLARLRDSSDHLIDHFTIVAADLDPVEWGRLAADSVVSRLWPQYESLFHTTGGPGGRPLAATRAYFAGEEAFERDDWSAAEDAYREALRIDSTFALAGWRLALCRRWRRVPFEEDLARLFERNEQQLPELTRLLIRAQFTPDVEQRLRMYASAVRRYPRDGYAALEYANETFARGPLVGVPLDSALARFRRAATVDPYADKAPALTHIVWGAIRMGHRDEASKALGQRLRIPQSPGEDVAVPTFLRLAYHERFHPAIGAIIRWWVLRSADSATVGQLARITRLTLTFDLPGSEVSLARVVERRSRLTLVKAGAHRAMGLGLMAQGRAREALIQFDSAALLTPLPEAALNAAEWRVLPALMGFPGPDEDARQAGRERLSVMLGSAGTGARAALALALDGLARGDTGMTRLATARLRTLAQVDSTAARLLRLVTAWELAAGGNVAQALLSSEPLLAYDSTGRIGGPFGRSLVRLSRARWEEALGRPEQAARELLWTENSDLIGWPEGEVQAGEVDAVMSGLARLRRARLALAGGDLDTACPLLTRVGQLWQAADTSLLGLSREVAELQGGCR